MQKKREELKLENSREERKKLTSQDLRILQTYEYCWRYTL